MKQPPKYGMRRDTIHYWQQIARERKRMTGWPYRTVERYAQRIIHGAILDRCADAGLSSRIIGHYAIELAEVLPTATLRAILSGGTK